jgi:two-component system, NarL family, response regulator NreC
MAAQTTPDPDGKPITVILADDHEVVRDGIRMIVEAQGDMQVVAEEGDADAARRRVSGLKPSVLVLDLNMPGEPSMEVLPTIAEASPETSIVVLTMQEDPGFAREAFRRGANGYVLKHAAGRELVEAIREAVAGRRYINPRLGAQLAIEPEGPPADLTPREAEILGLIAAGYMNPEIAERLVISVRTVETHRSAIQRKLGTVNRAELVAFAKQHGLEPG